jgi:hypothetical protein
MNMLRSLHFLWNHPLNRHDRLAALSRFLRWQIGSRLLPGPIVYSWIGMTGNLYAGLHEFADMAYLLHVLRAGDFLSMWVRMSVPTPCWPVGSPVPE